MSSQEYHTNELCLLSANMGILVFQLQNINLVTSSCQTITEFITGNEDHTGSCHGSMLQEKCYKKSGNGSNLDESSFSYKRNVISLYYFIVIYSNAIFFTSRPLLKNGGRYCFGVCRRICRLRRCFALSRLLLKLAFLNLACAIYAKTILLKCL